MHSTPWHRAVHSSKGSQLVLYAKWENGCQNDSPRTTNLMVSDSLGHLGQQHYCSVHDYTVESLQKEVLPRQPGVCSALRVVPVGCPITWEEFMAPYNLKAPPRGKGGPKSVLSLPPTASSCPFAASLRPPDLRF